LLLVSQPRTASATALNIDFGSFFGTPSSAYGASANQAGNWNEITTTGSSNLFDLSGNALPGTTLSLSLSSPDGPGFYGTNGYLGPNFGLTANDQALVGDWFYAYGNWTVTLSGLQNGLYNLYVYSGNNPGTAQTGAYSVNGVTEANLIGGDNDNSPLEDGVNYAIDSVLISNGTLSIDSSGSDYPSTGLAGLQLVPALTATPLPATLPLFAGGLGFVGYLARRRKRTGKYALVAA
jgi:hypothetical protein